MLEVVTANDWSDQPAARVRTRCVNPQDHEKPPKISAQIAQQDGVAPYEGVGCGFKSYFVRHVAVAQLVEHQVVALNVTDSSSVGHPIKYWSLWYEHRRCRRS